MGHLLIAHRTKEMVDLLKCETPDFTRPSLWPPNNPYVTAVDYEIWGVFSSEVGAGKSKLWTSCNSEEWERLDQRVIDKVTFWRCAAK